jgi:hypothetical protein
VGAQPPYQVGQRSPDGMWWWDGRRWVPVAQPGAQPPRRTKTWLWWLGGGCAIVLVIGVAGGIYGIVTLVRTAQSGGLACLPSDFPNYPNVNLTGEHVYYGTNAAPGDSHECLENFDSSDDVTTVTDFYASHLDSGDWHVTSNDTANGEIKFNRVSRPQTVGVVDLLGRGQHTTIHVKLDY